MLTRLTAKLRADRTLRDSLRRLTATDLASPANTTQAVLLDDSTSSLLLRSMATNVHALPESLCGSFMGRSAMPAGDLDDHLPGRQVPGFGPGAPLGGQRDRVLGELPDAGPALGDQGVADRRVEGGQPEARLGPF